MDKGNIYQKMERNIYIMNWKKFENFLGESSCGCEVNLTAFARCEEFCSFFDITINVPENEVESVEVDALIYAEPKVNLNEETRKRMKDKAFSMALSIMDFAGVDEDDIGWRFSVEFSRDSDGSEEEIMSRLWPSSDEKIIDFTTKTGD